MIQESVTIYLGLVNEAYKRNLFKLVHPLYVVFQPLAIDFEYSHITWVLDFDSTIGKDLFHHK